MSGFPAGSPECANCRKTNVERLPTPTSPSVNVAKDFSDARDYNFHAENMDGRPMTLVIDMTRT
jgi:hypothetical protein